MPLRARSLAIAALFFAALWTPLIGMFFGAGNFRPDEENRNLTLSPTRALTAYIHDRFGFRATLITAQALLRVKLLSSTTSPDVLIGKEGWLYYTGEKSMDNYRGALPFAPSERAAWVKALQSSQLVVIVPDKQTVYPEFLPDSIHKIKPRTRLDELIAAASGTNVHIVDLRPALQAAKSKRRNLYYPTDTHWTPAGAYVAYTRILREFPTLHPRDYTEPTTTGPLQAGDIVKMLGLGRVWKDIPETQFAPEPLPRKLTLLMSGDSFLPPLAHYLSANFSPAKPGTQPDLLLMEIVERKLNAVPAFAP